MKQKNSRRKSRSFEMFANHLALLIHTHGRTSPRRDLRIFFFFIPQTERLRITRLIHSIASAWQYHSPIVETFVAASNDEQPRNLIYSWTCDKDVLVTDDLQRESDNLQIRRFLFAHIFLACCLSFGFSDSANWLDLSFRYEVKMSYQSPFAYPIFIINIIHSFFAPPI